MKKALIILLAAALTVLCASCGSDDNAPDKKSATVVHIANNKNSDPETNGIKFTEEVIEKATKSGGDTDNTEATAPSEATEPATTKKKKKSKKLPTQGVTQPGTYIAVTTAPSGSFSDKDLRFVFEGAYIDINDEIEDALALLGEDNSVSELTKTKTEYQYDNLTLITTLSGDKEIVEEITVTTNALATAKGAKVGMYATKLRTIYGYPTSKNDYSYVYKKGDKSLTFYFANNIVTSYTYR